MTNAIAFVLGVLGITGLLCAIAYLALAESARDY